MGIPETLLFYLMIGLAVMVAVWATTAERPTENRLFCASTAVFFWPLYLPILLTHDVKSECEPTVTVDLPTDELSAKIAEVGRELDAAFLSLDGWAEESLANEQDRFIELRAAWDAQAKRVREMDTLLAAIHVAEDVCDHLDPVELPDNSAVPADRIHQSQRARRDNFIRLQQVRNQAYEDLSASLERVRELVSLIHLAKYTGAPVSRTEQLVLEIAASVESLSEVAAWTELTSP